MTDNYFLKEYVEQSFRWHKHPWTKALTWKTRYKEEIEPEEFREWFIRIENLVEDCFGSIHWNPSNVWKHADTWWTRYRKDPSPGGGFPAWLEDVEHVFFSAVRAEAYVFSARDVLPPSHGSVSQRAATLQDHGDRWWLLYQEENPEEPTFASWFGMIESTVEDHLGYNSNRYSRLIQFQQLYSEDTNAKPGFLRWLTKLTETVENAFGPLSSNKQLIDTWWLAYKSDRQTLSSFPDWVHRVCTDVYLVFLFSRDPWDQVKEWWWRYPKADSAEDFPDWFKFQVR